MAAGTTIQHKRKAGAFTGGQLAAGEIGVDTTNGALYFSTDGATVATLTPYAAVTLGASLTDVMSLSGQVLSAVDAGSDKLKAWDESAGKEVYVTIGAGLAMTDTTLSGDCVKLATATAAGDATIDFTNSSYFDGTYSRLQLVVSMAAPATDAVSTYFRVRTSATWRSTNYATTNFFSYDGGNSHQAGGTTYLYLGGAGSGSHEYGSYVIDIFNPSNTTKRKQIVYRGYEVDLNSNNVVRLGGGAYTGDTAALDGIRFLYSSGNVASGIFTLYGYK